MSLPLLSLLALLVVIRSLTCDSLVHLQKKLAANGPEVAFNRTTTFDELRVLVTALPYLRRTLAIEDLEIISAGDVERAGPGFDEKVVDGAEPNQPGVHFYNRSV